jgi:hypothetical protein
VRFPWETTQPLRVEVALNTATAPPEWRDVSALVKGDAGVHITRGGGRRHKDVPAGDCRFTLDNTAGTFSDVSGMALSLYRKRARVSYRTPGTPGNFLDAESASFEGGTVGSWNPGGSVPPALTNSTAHPQSGTKGMLITWGTGGSFISAGINVPTVIGRKYTASAYVWIPAGHPAVQLVIAGVGFGVASTTFGAMQRISITWTATTSSAGLQIWPTSAPTAGQQCYVDAVQVDEGTAPVTFTTNPPPISYRFTGRIATNDLTFPALGRALTTLVATDESAWQGSTYSTLRSVPVQEILSDAPTYLATLADGDLGDVSGMGGGPLTLSGTGTVPTPSATAIAASTTALGTTFATGQYYAAAIASNVGGFFSTGVVLEAAVRTTSVTEGAVAAAAGGFGPGLVLSVDADGKPRARCWNVFTPGTYTANAVSSVAVNDGQPHHLAARWTIATGVLDLYVDGVLRGTATAPAADYVSTDRVTIGGSTHLAPFDGLVAHVALTNSPLSGARIAEHAAALLTAFRGETVASRLARYNRWAGSPFGVVTAVSAVASVGHFDTAGKSVADAINAVSTIEDGITFVAGDGTLMARGRATLLGATAVYTVPGPTAGQASRVRNTLKYSTNPLGGIVNDLTGTAPGGITVRVIDSTSQGEWGHAEDSVDGPFIDENALNAVIEWRVATEATPQPYPDGLSVRMSQLDDATTTTILAVDLGHVIAWTNMPGQAPAVTDTGVVLGIEETYTPEDLLWTVTLAPSPGSDVWVLEDATFGAIDSTHRIAY